MPDSLPPVGVGRIVGLWRYPVKSMAGEALPEVGVSWHGFAGDRRWAFVRQEAAGSGFPWLTLRNCGDLALYRPSLVDPERPDRSDTVVRTPGGSVLDVMDPAFAAELSTTPVWPIKQDRGVFDTFPLSLITTQTISRLAETVGLPLAVERFRPNFLLEAFDAAEFPEDRWVGRSLRIGSLRLRVDKRDGRCVVITLDPVTAEREPKILRAVASDRQGCLGVYASTVEPGTVALGDAVYLEG